MNTAMIITLIGAAGSICGIVFGYVGYRHGLQSDSYQNGSHDGELKSDIQYVKRMVEDVLLEQRETNHKVTELTERVARVEESVKSAHHRIDKLEGKREQ